MDGAMSPKSLTIVVYLGFLAGCTTLQPAMKPGNIALTELPTAETAPEDRGDIFLFLSFSGGGTRAAALSYGVLEELRDTVIPSDGKNVRLLDEVDVISSVSGGSFTAAYYGLYGERIFDDFTEVFLERNVQKDLILRILNPVSWIRSVTTGISRTEAAIEYYDKRIFKNATFADLFAREGPTIEINATDLGTADRFAFTPQTFRLICTDLSRIKVSEAVAASSAFPVAFAPVVLANHAGSCGVEKPEWMRKPQAGTRYFVRKQTIIENMESYLDADERPYIHLVDGGIADNLGLRAVIDRVIMRDGAEEAVDGIRKRLPEAVVIIVVNAETEPARPFEQSPKKPTFAEIVTALGDAHIRQGNLETRSLIQEDLAHWTSELSQSELGTYYIEVSFEGIEAPGTRAAFNSIATTLALPENEVEMLREAGHELLRESVRFRELLADLR
jgi:NTE family protein